MCNSRRGKPCLALLDTNLCRCRIQEIYVPLHRYNLKYSRNPDSSSCWTRLRCNVHGYSGTCIVLHRMPFYYQTFWVWYTRRTFSVHVSDLWAFIHCTRTKTLQNELQGVQNLRNNNSAKVNPLRPLFTNCFLWYWWS